MALKVGAEPKKLAVLVGLLGVAVTVLFMNSGEDAVRPTTSKPAAPVAGPVAPSTPLPPPGGRGTGPQRRGLMDRSGRGFRVTMRDRDKANLITDDPTLRLDLLAKVQNAPQVPVGRNLFEFGSAPVAKLEQGAIPKVTIKPQPPGATPPPAPPVQAGPAAPPPPPPIPLRFFGYTSASRQGAKRAFFVEGEDIFVAGEGELVKRRYRIVRIGVNSVVVEDTATNSTQTLPLELEAAG